MRALFLALLTVGCAERNAATCLETHCPDPGRPFCDVDGEIGGEENACIAVDCTPGEFETCRGDTALTCNSAGNNYDLLECEFGCDNGSGCKPCTASSQCEKHIAPKYVFTACNQLTTNEDLIVSADTTLDTANDASCTSVVTQTNGPEICIVRNHAIRISDNQTLKVIGPRALALVADRGIVIDGVLDVSADGGSSGPGGGFITSGVTPEFGNELGGGGAGGRDPGGAGADNTTPGAAANGGAAATNPSLITALVGGAEPAPALFGFPGGGGGAVTLISCRNEVRVTGVIDAGGGGGDGEKPGGTKRNRASGGGAGGTIVLQGVDVTVIGTVVANGGGGGGSAALTDAGPKGQDGTRTTSRASGGISAVGNGGSGGALTGPSPGGVSRGAGGGSAGFIQVYVPAGTVPTIDAFVASPPIETAMVGSN